MLSSCESKTSPAAQPVDPAAKPPNEEPAAKQDAPPTRKIDSEKRARQLARAIYSDIALYHEESCRDAPPLELQTRLSEPLAEGRELFRSRTIDSLHSVFEDEFSYFFAAVSWKLKVSDRENAAHMASMLLRSISRRPPSTEEIAKARKRFESAVPESFHDVFEEELRKSKLEDKLPALP
jgi:hypothetical protein